MADVDPAEYEDERLAHASRWIWTWGGAYTAVLVIVWPILSLPATEFSVGYFTFWAVVSIIWGTVASAVIIFLPLWESWGGLLLVLNGMFTSDILLEKVDDINLKVLSILDTMPEAEKAYLLKKEKLKKALKEVSAPGLDHLEHEGKVDIDNTKIEMEGEAAPLKGEVESA